MSEYTTIGPITTPFEGTAYACNICSALLIEADDPRHKPAIGEARTQHILYHHVQTIAQESKHNMNPNERELTYEDYELETDGSWWNSATDFPATPTETNLLNKIDTLEDTLETINELINLYKTKPDFQTTIRHILQQIEEINEDND